VHVKLGLSRSSLTQVALSWQGLERHGSGSAVGESKVKQHVARTQARLLVYGYMKKASLYIRTWAVESISSRIRFQTGACEISTLNSFSGAVSIDITWIW